MSINLGGKIESILSRIPPDSDQWLPIYMYQEYETDNSPKIMWNLITNRGSLKSQLERASYIGILIRYKL